MNFFIEFTTQKLIERGVKPEDVNAKTFNDMIAHLALDERVIMYTQGMKGVEEFVRQQHAIYEMVRNKIIKTLSWKSNR
jgi:hypothetical protein